MPRIKKFKGIFVKSEIHNRFKKFAADRGHTLSWLTEKAINECMEKIISIEKKVKK